MQFSDKGYIIKVLKHGETSAIVTVLSSQYGKITGFVKGGLSKKKLGVYQLGNLISFNAYARLEENMPQFLGVELLKANAVNFFNCQKKLALLSSFCELMNISAVENESLDFLSSHINQFMDSKTFEQMLIAYSFFEFYLLKFLGVGLDLSECAATGTSQNLEFVSPKSSKAVCYEAGLPYKDKLFKFPHYVVDKNYNPRLSEVADLLKMTEFFLNKNFFENHGLKFPNNRGNLLNILNLPKE